MEDLKFFQRQRRIKQFFSASLFVLILALGWISPLLGYFIPLCMLLGIGTAVFYGRKWCDWICPRGSFYDLLVKPLSPGKNIPRILKNLYFRTGVIIFLLVVMGINIALRWPDTQRIGSFFVLMLTATTVLGVALALIFHPRSWCSFCPIGTLANLIGKNRLPLLLDSSSCVECKLCFKHCPIQVSPYAFKSQGRQKVKDGDCLKCNLCICACPTKSLSR